LPPEVRFLRLKCTKFYFGWGSAPDPLGELTTLLQTRTLAGFKPKIRGLLPRGGREGKEREGKGSEGNVEFHHLLLGNLTTGITYKFEGGLGALYCTSLRTDFARVLYVAEYFTLI